MTFSLSLLDVASIGLFVCLVLSLNLISGFGRYLVFCQAGFYGVGAYTVAIMETSSVNVPSILLLPLAGLVAGTVGLFVGLPIWRTAGVYFAMITWGIGAIIQNVFLNAEITGGALGKGPVDPPSLLGWTLVEVEDFALLSLALVIGFCVILALVLRSRLGWALRGVGEHPQAAQMLGMSYARVLVAFVVSASLAGLAGGAYGYLVTYVSPDPFGIDLSTLVLVALIVGGLGSVAGALVGAVFIEVVEVALRAYPLRAELFFGLVLLLAIHLRPEGLLPSRVERRLVSRLSARWSAAPDAPVTATSSSPTGESR